MLLFNKTPLKRLSGTWRRHFISNNITWVSDWPILYQNIKLKQRNKQTKLQTTTQPHIHSLLSAALFHRRQKKKPLMCEIKRINLLFILIFWNSCYGYSGLFSGNKILKFSILVGKFTLSAVKSWPYNFPLYAEYSTKTRNNHPASSVPFLSYSNWLLVMQFFNHRLQGRLLRWLL